MDYCSPINRSNTAKDNVACFEYVFRETFFVFVSNAGKISMDDSIFPQVLYSDNRGPLLDIIPSVQLTTERTSLHTTF